MTLEEIQALTIDDVRTELTARVVDKYTEQLENNPQLIDELVTLEFPIYINELLEEEEARLLAEAEQQRVLIAAKRDEVLLRLNEMGDIREAYDSLHSEPNMKLWLVNNITGNPDVYDAEAKLDEIENKKNEIASSPEVTKSNWESALRQDLADNNITTDGLLEALVRKLLLDDSTLADSLATKLQEINTRNPRP